MINKEINKVNGILKVNGMQEMGMDEAKQVSGGTFIINEDGTCIINGVLLTKEQFESMQEALGKSNLNTQGANQYMGQTGVNVAFAEDLGIESRISS